MGWWSNIWKTSAKDWIFEPLNADQVPDALERRSVAPESHYLSAFLRSMRITHVRRGLSKFYGTVHSYMSVPHLTSDLAEFQVVTSPANLRDIDAKNVDRVISMNHRLLGPIPYRGGDFELEVGLFSVKSADLAAPFIELLESMSSVAGVSFVNAAIPFARPIRDGINLLTGGSDPAILEVGLATTFNRPETGYFFVMRAEKGKVDPADLRVDEDFRLVGSNGESIDDYPYLVVAIEASERRDDWFRIPELAASYRSIQEAVRSGKIKEAEEAFAVFKRTVITSPDLLIADARKLVGKVKEEVRSVMEASLTSSTTAELGDLETLGLYPN